jgi:carboxyl-terminal processing protease
MNEHFFDANFRGVDWPAMKAKYRPQAEAAPDDSALYRVLNTMLSELKESHLAAITPRQSFEEENRAQVLTGFFVSRLEGKWVVVDVYHHSPAEEAGLRPGWLALSRNGQPIGDRWDFPRPQAGQAVDFQFLDEQDHPHDLHMMPRLVVTQRENDVRLLPGGVVYLRFGSFGADSRRWLSAQLKAHRDAPAVVLDLRRNPGGGVFSLEIALGEFFPKAVDIGVIVRRSGTESPQGAWQWWPARYTGKVAILVDGSSASAAEIFTHVMQFHHRAIVVGRRTAGAVIVAREYSLPDGGRLQVATEDYRGLDGKRLEGNGVKPDVEVELKLADVRAGRDRDLEAALRALADNQQEAGE